MSSSVAFSYGFLGISISCELNSLKFSAPMLCGSARIFSYFTSSFSWLGCSLFCSSVSFCSSFFNDCWTFFRANLNQWVKVAVCVPKDSVGFWQLRESIFFMPDFERLQIIVVDIDLDVEQMCCCFNIVQRSLFCQVE